MNPKNGKHSIQRIRTFSADVGSLQGTSEKTPEPDKKQNVAPQTQPPEKQVRDIPESVSRDILKPLPVPIKETQKKIIQTSTKASAPIRDQQSASHSPVEKVIPKPPVFSNPPHTQTPPITPLSRQSTAHTTPQQDRKLEKLNKEMLEVARPYRKSILTDDETYESKTLETGTIIRDTKRKRFRLIPAMFSASLSWFTGMKEGYATARPVHTVAKSDVRASIIQKAAEKSEQAPREDFDVVTQRLKKVERTPISTTLTFKKKTEVEAPRWSHLQEGVPEDALPAEPKQEQTIEAAKEVTQDTVKAISEDTHTTSPLPAEPTPIQEIVPEPPVQEQVEEAQSSTAPAQDKEIETISTPLGTTDQTYEPESVRETYEEYKAPEIIEDEPEQQIIPTDVPQTRTSAPAEPAAQSTGFPFVMLFAVIVIVSILGAGVGYMLYQYRSKEPVQNTVIQNNDASVASLLKIQSKIGVPLGTDRITTLSAIQTALQQSSDITQIYPTVPTTNGNAPATLANTLSQLGFQLSDSFMRSIKEIDFGGVDGKDPYIVIQSSTFDTAFAGMLNWERYMSADLNPLFGTTVTQTMDPTSQVKPGVQPAYFKDAIASNKNVRLLLDEQGNDRIVYTFLNQTTILITTNRAALDKLLQRAQ